MDRGIDAFAKRQETEHGIAVRLPIGYGSINNAAAAADEEAAAESAERQDAGNSSSQSSAARTAAALSRYKYYSRIAPGAASQLIMPPHVVPQRFLLIVPFSVSGGQSSFVTIFSIWNTMMGTSLLSMPWAVKEAGFATSFVVMLLMTAVTFYTAYLVLNSFSELASSGVSVAEFSDVCRHHLGRVGEIVAVAFSAVALLGAIIVYWVLLSNFLYQSGKFAHSRVCGEAQTDATRDVFVFRNTSYRVLCPSFPKLPINGSSLTLQSLPESWSPESLSPESLSPPGNASDPDAVFQRVWSQRDTVPLYLLPILLPLVSIKSPTFFAKFNALGTLAVAYILVFVCAKAAQWGFHLPLRRAADHVLSVPQIRPSFPLLTGVLSLALFCHNAVITLTRNQKRPQNNNRDLLIAYICVSATYMLVGFLFYSAFPIAKDCIEQNFLDNIPASDTLAFTARIFLFVQMLTVFPLLVYILRAQLLQFVFGSAYPSWLHALTLHVCVLAPAVGMAHFYPRIGNILRFSGAACGLAYIFTLPSLVHAVSARAQGRLTVAKATLQVAIVLAGLANFGAQFLFLGK